MLLNALLSLRRGNATYQLEDEIPDIRGQSAPDLLCRRCGGIIPQMRRSNDCMVIGHGAAQWPWWFAGTPRSFIHLQSGVFVTGRTHSRGEKA